MYNLRFENLVIFNKRLHKVVVLHAKKAESTSKECYAHIAFLPTLDRNEKIKD